MKKRRRNRNHCLLITLSLIILNNVYIKAQHDSASVVLDSVVLEKEGIKPVYTIIDDSSLSVPIQLTTNNTWMFGIGNANMYDTYLSPLEYKGTSFRIYNEKMRRTTWFDHRFYKQQILELEFALSDNPAKNSSDYWIMINYRLGGHYTLFQDEKLRLGVGGLWDINLGVLYSQRNGNNPASARAYTNLNLSVMASYKLPWFAVRWQLDSPFIGMLFSPHYGQSYYEISLGNSTKVANFASFHNQRALRNYITLDIPINKYIVRVGYLGTYYQTKVHDLQTHHYTNSFVIGFPLEGIKQKRKKATNIYW